MTSSGARIRKIYLAARLLDTPLWAIYNMVPVILYKDLHASNLEIAFLVSLKPLMALLSFYFSHLMNGRRLTNTIIFARSVGVFLFFLFPLMVNIPLVLTACCLYMAMAVATTPSWIELCKKNLGEREQKKTLALGSSLGYLGGALFSFACALFLDCNPKSWVFLFQGAALISLFANYLIFRLKNLEVASTTKRENLFIDPWKQSLSLLKTAPDLAIFQTAFMAFGIGLMIVQPALPAYFVDELHMSYVELACALSFCKGISYAITAPFFAPFFHSLGIFRFSTWVTSLALLFPIGLMLSKWQGGCVYLSYIIYGCVQAGLELVWSMSGPLFAKDQESLSYTRLNIIMVGLRGALAPAFGAFLLAWIGSFWIQGVCIFFFLMAALIFYLPIYLTHLRHRGRILD